VDDVVRRFLPSLLPDVIIVSQDEHLSRNQQGGIRVGDNGIFKGCPVTDEQRTMISVAKSIVLQHPSDGKYIINHHICEEDANIKKWIFGRPPRVEWDVIICQSNVSDKQAAAMKDWLFESHLNAVINPLGAWTGGVNVDCGATNRKLGSDMGDAVTGGGLHGKDLSKADVSVNIMCHIKAQASRQVVTACTAIGDTDVTFRYADGTKETLPFAEVVEAARLYIMTQHGSFEHFAEWGLIA
jgi:S-adenosylmethionine synthetase